MHVSSYIYIYSIRQKIVDYTWYLQNKILHLLINRGKLCKIIRFYDSISNFNYHAWEVGLISRFFPFLFLNVVGVNLKLSLASSLYSGVTLTSNVVNIVEFSWTFFSSIALALAFFTSFLCTRPIALTGIFTSGVFLKFNTPPFNNEPGIVAWT